MPTSKAASITACSDRELTTAWPRTTTLRIKENTMSDTLKSVIRTFVPAVVGLILSGFTMAGVEIDPELEAQVTVLVDGLFIGAYYSLIRWLENKAPSFGWFLGLPSKPSYENKIFTSSEGYDTNLS